jgi:hypothetical protein
MRRWRPAAVLGLVLIVPAVVWMRADSRRMPSLTGSPRGRPPSVDSEYEVIILAAPSNLGETAGYGIGLEQVAGRARILGAEDPDQTHAIYWPAGTTVGVDLHPDGWTYSAAFDTNGSQQVGSGNGPPTNYSRHALLWSGDANGYVDLNPGDIWNDSVALAIAGTQQVGNVNLLYPGNESPPYSVYHAALWNGTPDSWIDLHPSLPGIDRSFAKDTDGVQQVGYGTFGGDHALVWSGSADSAVDLHPPVFTHSYAEGVHSGEQVGYAFDNNDPDGHSHALLWHGSAASVVDLHPQGWYADAAYATNGVNQVGFGGTPDAPYNSHAVRWSGTPESAVDLHSLLPAEFTLGSIAYDIDADGNIAGLAQRADGSLAAVLWHPTGSAPPPTATPAPSSTPPPTGTPSGAPPSTRTPSWSHRQ